MAFLDGAVSHGYNVRSAKDQVRASDEKWSAMTSGLFILALSLSAWGVIIAGCYLV